MAILNPNLQRLSRTHIPRGAFKGKVVNSGLEERNLLAVSRSAGSQLAQRGEKSCRGAGVIESVQCDRC